MSQIEFLHGDPQAPPDEPPPASADRDTPSGSAPEPRGRRRFGPRTLTSKLVAGVVSLVVVLVLLIGGGTWYSLRSFLSSRLDQQLQSTANGSLRSLFDEVQPPRAGGVRPPLDVWAVALSQKGSFLTYPSNDAVREMELSAAQRQQLATMDGSRTVSVTTTDGVQLRVTTRLATAQTQDGTTVTAVAVVGLSTSEEHRTLHRLISLEIVIGAGAVLLAIVLTTYGVQRSLRNLRRVTTTAQEVAADLSPEGTGLDRRVPDDEPGTEVGQLATSFNTMLAAVETQFAARLESEERMRQFMADASHELRTPLTSIRGYAELARMQRAAGSTSDDNLDRIEHEGTRMSRLVEDLLLLARGDADGTDRPAQRELIDSADLLDDAVRGSQAAFPERRIELDVRESTQLIGDRDQLVRVIRNLVNNAAVHTAVDRPVVVRAYGDGINAVVQIVDGGPGLSPDDAVHVFERFWRADKARTRARGGSGLGLSIVATIVRAHGGSVAFDSSVETGSTVTVVLPAAHAALD